MRTHGGRPVFMGILDQFDREPIRAIGSIPAQRCTFVATPMRRTSLRKKCVCWCRCHSTLAAFACGHHMCSAWFDGCGALRPLVAAFAGAVAKFAMNNQRVQFRTVHGLLTMAGTATPSITRTTMSNHRLLRQRQRPVATTSPLLRQQCLCQARVGWLHRRRLLVLVRRPHPLPAVPQTSE